ncbi:MAG: hypothetical protein ACHRHE_16030, partial [Tepidisphaerales bacterium]
GEPLGASLHRLRQYHTNLLNTYLKLLKKYEFSQNEPISETPDSAPVGSASADASPDAPAENEPNPAEADLQSEISNLKSKIQNPPISPLSTHNDEASTNSKSPAALLRAAIHSVPISSLPLNT